MKHYIVYYDNSTDKFTGFAWKIIQAYSAKEAKEKALQQYGVIAYNAVLWANNS